MDDDHPADIGRPRRRGDRITPLFCCGCLRPVMAQSGRKETSAFVRFLGQSGLVQRLRTIAIYEYTP